MRFIFTHPIHKPLIVDIPGCTEDIKEQWIHFGQMTAWNLATVDILAAPTI